VAAVNQQKHSTFVRRMRWQGGKPVTPGGDVRAFVLASAPHPSTAIAKRLAALKLGEAAASKVDVDG